MNCKFFLWMFVSSTKIGSENACAKQGRRNKWVHCTSQILADHLVTLLQLEVHIIPLTLCTPSTACSPIRIFRPSTGPAREVKSMWLFYETFDPSTWNLKPNLREGEEAKSFYHAVSYGTIHLRRQHVLGGRGVPICRWSKGHST